MNWSALSKAIRAGVISLNLVILPIALPVAAQTGSASSNSTTGSNSTSTSTSNSSSTNDANLSNSPTPSNSNPGTSDTSGGSTSGTSATPSPSSASASPSAAPSPSNANPSPSATSSSADTSTAPSQGTTSTGGEHQSEWGLLGLLGLIGLAGLLHRTATPRETATSSYASDRLDQGLTQAGVGASSLWNRLSTRASESRRRRAREKEIKRIKYSLGRPSNRVILDRQDNIILNVGDLITNQAVERARMNNMLDVLLDSVDAKTPEIAEAEHSAPVSGEASLEKRDRETGVDDH